MKKTIALLLCLALSLSLLSGCGGKSYEPSPAPLFTEAVPAETEAAPAETEAAPAETETAPAVTEPSGTDNCGFYDEEPEQPRGHYVFQPKVCSSCMTELFGEPMRDAWFSLVDAVLAGEDSFACPDDETYWWVMGQFPDQCFPVLKDLIWYGSDVDHPVKDGVAEFSYTVPKEEAAARIEAFAVLVEGILNEALRDEDSDFEKALALYLYFSDHYIYDYEAADPNTAPDYLSSYRVLTTGTGICQEFSVAYSYLLLQAGVDASVMSGNRSYDRIGHQWSYVRINGHDFHVDPTYVIGDPYSLAYFMMTDEQREEQDCYMRSDFVICSNYAQDHPHPAYAAVDDSFREIWRGRCLEFDREKNVLSYSAYNDEGQFVEMTFDYTGW